MLLSLAPEVHGDPPERGASKHLLIALDVSPSMQLIDAGPGYDKQSRALWAGKLVEGVLDRLDASTTRVSLVAFYTDSRPILKETFDKEVVSNVLDGLPMYAAFEPGSTKLIEGVNAALDLAKAWMPGSATLLVVSDGDALGTVMPDRIPASIADTIVLGVGDPHRTLEVGGHASRQDTTSLKTLAVRLGGHFHQGNEKHIPSALLEQLTMIEPRLGDKSGLRDLALILGTIGTAALALIVPALSLSGRSRTWDRARRIEVAGGAS
jgi:Ca-activated chloride channel family protein